jgi:uncharacterized damage-inducible protein DinB
MMKMSSIENIERSSQMNFQTNFKMEEAVEILERTPQTLSCLLAGLSDGWLTADEGEETWNVSEVIGHLIEGEKHDWIPRLEMTIQTGESVTFPVFDRGAHLAQPSGPIEEKLSTFEVLRKENIDKLKTLVNPQVHLELTGSHPAFGTVKLRELLSTWVVHDFTHMAQIVRVMASRYRSDVGPWIEYLGVLNRQR